MAHDTFRVVLIGRTNVGKSTFFSRITNLPSVSSHIKHTTRDAREGNVSWNRNHFTLIDTGGFDIARHEPYAEAITERIMQELKKADLVLLMTDIIDPVTHEESTWLHALMQQSKTVLLIFNKADKPNLRVELTGKNVMGANVFACSSKNGGGIGDILDAIASHIPKKTPEEPMRDFRLGLVGRTNVGKSSLLNAIAGEPRAIVSDQHHTTREPIAVTVPLNETYIEVVDTAGAIRHPQQELARKATELTDQIIDSCDVVALVLSYREHPIPAHDMELATTILSRRKSLIIVVNKWDLEHDRTHRASQDELRRVRRVFTGIPFVPIVLTSATHHVRIQSILETAASVYRERFVSLTEAQCNRVRNTLKSHVSSFFQLSVNPPRFHAVAMSRSVPRAITDLLHKKIRNEYPYLGTPIIVSLAKHTRRNASRARTGKPR